MLRRLPVAALLALLVPLAAADGLDDRDLDTAVAACADFYRHANGSWLRSHPVPAGKASFGLLDQLAARHRERQLALVDALAADPTRVGEPLADFIASGLDEAAIEATGRAPLAALLAGIDKIGKIGKPPGQVPALLNALHARGLPVAFRTDVQLHGGTPTVVLAAGGLGLPDRDYYLRDDPDTRELLGNYRRYVEQLLGLIGSPDPATDAAWVLDAEMRLARGWPAYGTAGSAELGSLREFGRRFPSLDWRGWSKAHGLSSSRVAIADPAYFSELDALIANAHPVQWRAWLKFRIAHLLAPFLDREIVAVHDAFHDGVLRGETIRRSRAERVLQATERVLGAQFDRALAERHLPEPRRAAAERLVESLRTELRSGVEQAPWIPAGERAALLERVDRLAVEIAVPAAPAAGKPIAFDRRRYLDNVLRAAAQFQRSRLAAVAARAPRLPPRGTPAMAVQYDSRSNKLQLGIGVLQSPLFQPERDPAHSHGALGALIGHELLHAVDLAGAAWAGQQVSEARIAAFRSHVAPLVEQYSGYRALGASIDGQRTLAVNAADLAGVELAWRALARSHDLAAPERNGRTPAQRFFLGWAQLWRRNYRDAELLRVVRSERQPPAEFRVNGPLAHLPAFAEAFGCRPGQPMRRADGERVALFGPAPQ